MIWALVKINISGKKLEFSKEFQVKLRGNECRNRYFKASFSQDKVGVCQEILTRDNM